MPSPDPVYPGITKTIIFPGFFSSLVIPLGGKHYVASTKIDISLGAVTLFWIKWTDCPNGINQENPLSLSSAFK